MSPAADLGAGDLLNAEDAELPVEIDGDGRGRACVGDLYRPAVFDTDIAVPLNGALPLSEKPSEPLDYGV